MTRSRSRRVIVVGVALIVAATCVSLGLWQLRRLDERRALNAQILVGRSDPPFVIDRAVAGQADSVRRRRVRDRETDTRGWMETGWNPIFTCVDWLSVLGFITA